jgi:hypothetical protein
MEFERNEKRPQQRAAKVIFSLSLSPVSASLDYYFACCKKPAESGRIDSARFSSCSTYHSATYRRFSLYSELLLIPIYVRTYTVGANRGGFSAANNFHIVDDFFTGFLCPVLITTQNTAAVYMYLYYG